MPQPAGSESSSAPCSRSGDGAAASSRGPAAHPSDRARTSRRTRRFMPAWTRRAGTRFPPAPRDRDNRPHRVPCMTVLVVTGTGTGVGKTIVTAAVTGLALDRFAAVAVVKPAQTGVAPDEPGDLDEVHRLTGAENRYELARYRDPLSPAAAARRSGMPPLDLNATAAPIAALASENDLVVVEGAGGLLVRYNDDGATLADLAYALRAAVVVVARAGLGTLNETALTLEVMAARGVQ